MFDQRGSPRGQISFAGLKGQLDANRCGRDTDARLRSPMFGALLVSLPLTSILAMMWLWQDTAEQRTNRWALVSHLLVVVTDASQVSCAAFPPTAQG
jgi:hypothetical protein